MGVQAAVVGASGFSGGEVLRYLAQHPVIEIAAATAGTKAGAQAAEVLPHLPGSDLSFGSLAELAGRSFDVVLSCVPDGAPAELLGDARVVDLSDRHRGADGWVYGLPELYRSDIATATKVANPGCYPTAALLCIAPFARAGLIEGPVIIDALSGTSGAGRKPEERLIHASLHGSAGAYGTVDHRHVGEIERYLTAAGLEAVVSFTPHLVPMSRGVLVTARGKLRASTDDETALGVLKDEYDDEPFVSVTKDWPATKGVAGTNRAVVSARVDARANMLVCSAAIDNLGKGAAGQAIQNVNLMFGLDETTGLEAVAVWP